MLPCIFNESDIIIQQEKVNVRGSGLPLTEWDTTKQFFSINPVKNYGDSRKGENVKSMKNFLFEIDTLPLEEQEKLVKKYKNIISMATLSGNKSIHFIIHLKDEPSTLEEYHYVWEQLRKTYFPCADKQCKDCLRLSRTPNALRDNGKKQILLWNTLQPIELKWKPLYKRIQAIENMAREYRKTIPIVRNEKLSYKGECVLKGEYPKGERDAILRKGVPYLFYNGYSLEEILENNENHRANPPSIRNFYRKLEADYRGEKRNEA
jgi:hypothetical protein